VPARWAHSLHFRRRIPADDGLVSRWRIWAQSKAMSASRCWRWPVALFIAQTFFAGRAKGRDYAVLSRRLDAWRRG